MRTCILITDVSSSGNLLQLFNVDAWSYHEYLYKNFGSVVKVHSLFGVSFMFWLDGHRMCCADLLVCKAEELYISDPLALQHVLLKGQDVFESPKMQLM